MKKGLSILLVVIIILSFSSCGKTQSIEEQYAIKNTEKLHNMMKDPDSFKLRDDVMVIRHEDKNGSRTFYTFIHASANNSYGASMQSVSVFKDGTFFADLDDYDELLEEARKAGDLWMKSLNDAYTDKQRKEYEKKTNDAYDKAEELLNAQIWYQFGAGYDGSESSDGTKLTTTIVSKKTVGKQAKVDYVK